MRFALAPTISSLVLIACGGGELVLESPADGAVVTTSDDVASDLDGLQTTVVVVARGMASGTSVDLRVDGATVDTAPTPDDGRLVFEITLASGDHTIDALGGGAQSPSITVTAIAECFALSFESPTPSGATLALGPDDDGDGEPCGATFEASFEIATEAADGSEARVYVDGAPRRTATVMAGRARFEGVPFDLRGASSEVRAEVTNLSTSQTCGAAFGVPITIDCEGVSCAIVGPDLLDPVLGPDDDVSDAPGFQLDLEVRTDVAADGQPVRLVIDGAESAPLTATASGGMATFPAIELSEGVHRFRAHCQDARGNATTSSPAEWTVDTVPCAFSFVAPYDGEVFYSTEDYDPTTPATDLPFEASLDPDCAALRVATCDAVDSAPYEDTTGEPTWYALLPFEAPGAYAVCGDARDLAGNVTRARVSFEIQAPP